MKIRKIGIALAAKKLDFTQHLRLIAILGKAAIGILEVAGGNDHSVSYFKKIGIIATLRASDPQSGIFFIHKFWETQRTHFPPMTGERRAVLPT